MSEIHLSRIPIYKNRLSLWALRGVVLVSSFGTLGFITQPLSKTVPNGRDLMLRMSKGRCGPASELASNFMKADATVSEKHDPTLKQEHSPDFLGECGSFRNHEFKIPLLSNLAGRGLNLVTSSFTDLRLEQSDLESASIQQTSFKGGTWEDDTLKFAQLQGSTFLRVKMNRVNLSNTAAGAIKFTESQLAQIDFHDADLRAASFINSSCQDCDLRGADLSEAVVILSNFDGSKFDQKTKLPFSHSFAQSRGMIYEP